MAFYGAIQRCTFFLVGFVRSINCVDSGFIDQFEQYKANSNIHGTEPKSNFEAHMSKISVLLAT